MSETTASPGSARTPENVPRPLPEWLHDRQAWTRCSAFALGVFGAAAAASLVLAIAVIALLGGGAGGAGSVGHVSGTDDGGFLRLWIGLLFAGHLVPLTVTAGGGMMAGSAFGIGSLVVTGLIVALSHRAGAHLELGSPPAPLAVQMARAARIAVPYAVLCLVASIIGGAVGSGTDVGVSPSALGLLTPWLLVGAGAALGSLAGRPTWHDSATLRAGRAGVYALLVGAGVLAVVGLLELVVEAATSSPSSGSVSGPAVLGGLAVAIGYSANLLGLGWGAATGLTVFGHGAWALLIVAPTGGALAGSLVLRKRAGLGEMASYALSFATASALLTFLAAPTISGSPLDITRSESVVGSPLVAFLSSLVLAGLAAFAAPYIPLRTAPLWARFAGATGGLMGLLPDRGSVPATGLTTDASGTTQAAAVAGASPALHVPRRVWLAGASVALVAGGLAVGNAVLSGRYGVESTVQQYFTAQASVDPDGILATTLYRSSGDGVSLTDAEAIRHMARIPGARVSYRDIRILSVTQLGSQTSALVSFTKHGTSQVRTLSLVRSDRERHLGLYPVWRVAIALPTLEVRVPAVHGPLTIDGLPVPVAEEGWAAASVIPGTHQVRTAAQGMLAEAVEVVDVDGPRTVTLKARLAPPAEAAARQQISAYFSRCAASTMLEPSGCPNAEYSAGGQVTNVHWALVRDPAATATLTLQDDGTVQVEGRWAMSVTYDDAENCLFGCTTPDVHHRGDEHHDTYSMSLVWDGSSFHPAQVDGFRVDPGTAPASEEIL